MPTLMGGSGSTGSTLLRTVLHRHPDLFSGEELNFFNKEQVFDDWERSRRMIFGTRFHRPFATRGWFAWPGQQLEHQDYGWTMDEIRTLMAEASNVNEFAHAFFARPLARKGARDWVEKTPSNAYAFAQFLRDFDDGRAVHTTRDPLAAVASLVRRGMDPVYAAGLWLHNTAMAMAVHGHPRYHLVRYEDLTEDPARAVAALCAFLDVPFRTDMLEPQEEDDADHLRNTGWTRSRTDPIVRSPSRYAALKPEVQRRILAALTLLRVSDSHAAAKGITLRSCAEIAPVLEYPFEPADRPSRAEVATVKQALRKDRWNRIRKRYPTGLTYYPLSVAVPS